jgi:purine-binding chemotaxis protein CheW
MGIVVDEVCEVLNLTEGDLQETPNFGQGISTPYLLGMAKVKGKVKILLDIDHVLASDDAAGLHDIIRDHCAEPVAQ